MEKTKLFNNTTSLQKLNLRIGESSVFMKRDDTIDFAFGGNKVRLFEYIAQLIKNSGADRVLTFGSQFSNFVRVTVTACALLNKECDIIILENDKCDGVNGGG